MIAKITVVLALVAVAFAQYHGDGHRRVHKTSSQGYPQQGHGHGYPQQGHGHGYPQQGYGHGRSSYKHESYEQPRPYEFSYQSKDDYNTEIYRQESGDDYGNVKGSYGYTDGYGLYRKVDYTADDYGFRAYIKTNEPGTDNQNPADVEIYADPAEVKYEAPKKGYNSHKAVAHAPSYGHRSYAAPSYGHRDSYAPVHKTSHASTHRRGYDDKKGGYGHDSHVTSHGSGYKAPSYHGVAVASTHRRGYDDKKGAYGHASKVVSHRGHHY